MAMFPRKGNVKEENGKILNGEADKLAHGIDTAVQMKGKPRMKKLWRYVFVILTLLGLGGCGMFQVMDGDGMVRSYKQISQEEAMKMMEADDGHVILDVRRIDEYNEGHIPGAICVPNESITDEHPKELPDLDQVILVYCRSGRRSKEAAQKLFDMGYANIYEFGGIMDWTGEVVSEEANAMESVGVMVLRVGDEVFTVDLENNGSSEAFFEKVKEGPLTVEMHDYGNFEKVGDLPWKLDTNDEKITTKPGDVILYQGDKITVYYDENTWNFTKIGSINGVTGEELRRALGDGDVKVEFMVEWTE